MPNPTPEQPRDVGEMVRAAFELWAGDHGLPVKRVSSLADWYCDQRTDEKWRQFKSALSTLPSSPGAEAMRLRIEKAQRMLSALCRGEERWVMRVPAEPDRDPDLVIADGLAAELEALRALPTPQDGAGEVREALTDALTLMDEKGRSCLGGGSIMLWRRDWNMLRATLLKLAALTTPAARGETPPGASTEPAYEMQEGEGEVERIVGYATAGIAMKTIPSGFNWQCDLRVWSAAVARSLAEAKGLALDRLKEHWPEHAIEGVTAVQITQNCSTLSSTTPNDDAPYADDGGEEGEPEGGS